MPLADLRDLDKIDRTKPGLKLPLQGRHTLGGDRDAAKSVQTSDYTNYGIFPEVQDVGKVSKADIDRVIRSRNALDEDPEKHTHEECSGGEHR